MNVLLVYKRSFLETQRALKTGWNPPSRDLLRKIHRSDEENRLAKQEVLKVLADAGAHVDILWRGSLPARTRYDLVVTVGGDGTFFSASHVVARTPILGVNSDPRNSLALFSCTDRFGFRETFRRYQRGRLPVAEIHRLSVRIGRKKIPVPVVNDILYAHLNPAALSRYVIRVGARREEQKSSGVWIATAAGSTAAILSAGGRMMAWNSRKVQYLVREPYTWGPTPYRLLQGISNSTIALTSLMNRAMVYIDGSRVRYPVRFGEQVVIGGSAPSLRVVGFSPARRRAYFQR